MKKPVVFLAQIGLLWGIFMAGQEIVKLTHLPIPGNVCGMLLLFVMLATGILKLQWIDAGATWILKHLSFFFIPISAGLMTLGTIFIHEGLVLFLILAVSAAAGILGTGFSAQVLARSKKESYEQQHSHTI
ncbi:CidA/LrgA family protein [Heyndrickxia acidiproducens]|uniref:CidA/LrgA family protein n=1 Tax=Heyndrickxia acidiproducens TaxID=1121084 RepID=UPI000379337F|nr:CidA/LrgA family protein [Heyndrickxia acidiproducens]